MNSDSATRKKRLPTSSKWNKKCWTLCVVCQDGIWLLMVYPSTPWTTSLTWVCSDIYNKKILFFLNQCCINDWLCFSPAIWVHHPVLWPEPAAGSGTIRQCSSGTSTVRLPAVSKLISFANQTLKFVCKFSRPNHWSWWRSPTCVQIRFLFRMDQNLQWVGHLQTGFVVGGFSVA